MKRSCTGDNSPIIKKKVRDNNEELTTPTPTTPTPTPTLDMSVLRYVHDLVHNLEQGNIDHCLSNTNNKTENILQQLSKQDADLFNALDLNLKKIAQRQLQLETENLRCRIMIQQQHQLLTATPTSTPHHEEESTTKVTLKSNNNNTPVKQATDSPTQGTINISVDESFKPVMEEQIRMYEASFPEAKIIASYKTAKPRFYLFKSSRWPNTNQWLL